MRFFGILTPLCLGLLLACCPVLLAEEEGTRPVDPPKPEDSPAKGDAGAKSLIRKAFQKDPKKVFQFLVKELRLTEPQIEKVRDLGLELKAKAERLVAESKAAGDPAKTEAIVKELRDELLTRVREVLDDKQKARFDKVLEGGEKELRAIADRHQREQERNPEFKLKRQLKTIQASLGLLPEEAMILMPKIEDILRTSAQAQVGLKTQRQQIQTLIKDQAVSDETVKKELALFRRLRDAAVKILAPLQDDLRELLTHRQEAQLVLFGVLK